MDKHTLEFDEAPGPPDNDWERLVFKGRTWIAPKHTLGRHMLVAYAGVAVAGLALALVLRQFDRQTLMQVHPVIVILVGAGSLGLGTLAALLLAKRFWKDTRLSFLEPTGPRVIHLPRRSLTLEYDEIDAVVVIEDAYKTSDQSIPVSRLLFSTPRRETAFVPILTTNPLHRDFERTARDLANDIGVPLRRVTSEC